MTTLFYSLIRTEGEDAEIHPQKMMEKLNISYKEAEPIPIIDGWFFFNCQNIPDELPYFLIKIKK